MIAQLLMAGGFLAVVVTVLTSVSQATNEVSARLNDVDARNSLQQSVKNVLDAPNVCVGALGAQDLRIDDQSARQNIVVNLPTAAGATAQVLAKVGTEFENIKVTGAYFQFTPTPTIVQSRLSPQIDGGSRSGESSSGSSRSSSRDSDDESSRSPSSSERSRESGGRQDDDFDLGSRTFSSRESNDNDEGEESNENENESQSAGGRSSSRGGGRTPSGGSTPVTTFTGNLTLTLVSKTTGAVFKDLVFPMVVTTSSGPRTTGRIISCMSSQVWQSLSSYQKCPSEYGVVGFASDGRLICRKGVPGPQGPAGGGGGDSACGGGGAAGAVCSPTGWVSR